MKSRLYLIDGMSHIYRAYYAIQGLRNKKGFPTNAVYGFTSMLRKLIKEEQPEYLGVAIDLTGPTVRHEQYEAYKSTRRPMPEDLAEQIPFVLRVCEALCVPILSFPKYEADDVIGTLSRKATAADLDVVIVTIDKDMFQLVNDRVIVLDTRTMVRLDRAGVEEKFGVPPEQVVDVLSLVGDSSDNIPGAPGIGQKGAVQLIQQYSSLDELLKNRDRVERKTYRESLQQNEALICQSRELVRIFDELPLELDLDKLRRCEPDPSAARELFAELEFTSLLDEYLPETPVADKQYSEVATADELAAIVDTLKGKPVALGLVFPGDQYLHGSPAGLAFTGQPHQARFISDELLASDSVQPLLGELLAEASPLLIHDLKPLVCLADRCCWHVPPGAFDTMLMAYLLSPNTSDFALNKLAIEFLGSKLSESQEGADQDVKVTAWEKADLTYQVFQVLHPKLAEKQLVRLLQEIEIPLVEVLASMEKVGVKIDCDFLAGMSGEMQADIDRLTEKIFTEAGESFNINSPRQLGVVLFDKLNLPQPKKTRKAGHYATGFEVLEQLSAQHELPRLILEYRELSKLKSTYLDALPRLVSSRTGRIHTCYNQMVASTGRLSSSNPNLQNIPIKSEVGRKIRRAFIPEAGFRILAADYSQIELRVMAHLSQDPVLIDSFRSNEDIHERTAREVFGMAAVMNPKEFRRHAKVFNYGIMYGLSAFGLAQNLKIERHEAQKFIDDYFRRYRGVKKWIDQTLEQARETGCVTTLFGRIRQIPEINTKNWAMRSFGERTAINAPIQGTAADLIKKAMVTMHREMLSRNLKSRLIMQVHDELVFEVAEAEIESMSQLVRDQMEHAAELSVPLQVDLAVGNSWLEAK